MTKSKSVMPINTPQELIRRLKILSTIEQQLVIALGDGAEVCLPYHLHVRVSREMFMSQLKNQKIRRFWLWNDCSDRKSMAFISFPSVDDSHYDVCTMATFIKWNEREGYEKLFRGIAAERGIDFYVDND